MILLRWMIFIKPVTPALNKYGVNFDIVREIPTQYDESGGIRPIWYWIKMITGDIEADVELCWTNADQPEECRHVTIHITGNKSRSQIKGAWNGIDLWLEILFPQ